MNPSFSLKAPICTKCKNSGIPVRILTVKSVLKKEFRELIQDKAYYLCMTPNCHVAYYTIDNSTDILSSNMVKVPIWFKKNAEPKYACYCNKITYEEALETVIKTGLDKMEEITKSIRDKKKCACTVMNPSGRCCTPLYTQAIEDGLKRRNKRSD